MYSISGKFGLIQAASSAATQQQPKKRQRAEGRFQESDDVGRSLGQDRKKVCQAIGEGRPRRPQAEVGTAITSERVDRYCSCTGRRPRRTSS
jgi:hypothetical protein